MCDAQVRINLTELEQLERQRLVLMYSQNCQFNKLLPHLESVVRTHKNRTNEVTALLDPHKEMNSLLEVWESQHNTEAPFSHLHDSFVLPCTVREALDGDYLRSVVCL